MIERNWIETSSRVRVCMCELDWLCDKATLFYCCVIQWQKSSFFWAFSIARFHMVTGDRTFWSHHDPSRWNQKFFILQINMHWCGSLMDGWMDDFVITKKNFHSSYYAFLLFRDVTLVNEMSCNDVEKEREEGRQPEVEVGLEASWRLVQSWLEINFHFMNFFLSELFGIYFTHKIADFSQ